MNRAQTLCSMTGEALPEETDSKQSGPQHHKQAASTVKDTQFLCVSDACFRRLLMLRESLLNVFTCSLKFFQMLETKVKQ